MFFLNCDILYPSFIHDVGNFAHLDLVFILQAIQILYSTWFPFGCDVLKANWQVFVEGNF